MDNDTPEPPLVRIVERAQQGDSAALTELVVRCRDMATRHALSILGDRSLAEEAAQEALSNAVTSLPDLQAPEAFITWLRAIVARQCDRLTRRRRLSIVPLSQVVEPTETQPSPEELVLRAERALAVRNAIEQLPTPQREAVTAYYLEDRTQAEVAEVLDTPVSTVNNRLHTARTTLKRRLTSMNDGPDQNSDSMQLAAPSAETDSDRIYAALEPTGPAGSHWRRGRLAHSGFDWDTSRLAVDGGEVRALVGVYDLSMRIGRSNVRTAGFNLDYRSQQTADATMEHVTVEAVEAARHAGYAIAVSVGHTDALLATGFIPAWPHLMWFVPTDALSTSGSHQTDAFDPVHREDLAALYDREHAGLTGSTIRPTYLANKEPDGFEGRLWTDDTGDPAGYVSFAVVESWTNRKMLGPSHRGYDRLFWHDESAGDPATRLDVLGQLARKHDCQEIAFDRLHPRSPLALQIRTLQHRVEHGYRQYALKVLSVEAILRAMVDELDQRLSASPIDQEVELRVTIDSDGATICGGPGHLSIDTSTGREKNAIKGDQRLAKLLLGTSDPNIILNGPGIDVSGDGPALAAALFPAEDPQMDNQSL